MLPSRGGRRVLSGVEWLGPSSQYVRHASSCPIRSTGLKLEVSIQGRLLCSHIRHISTRATASTPRPSFAGRKVHLLSASNTRPFLFLGIGNTTATQRFSLGLCQVRHQSTSQTGPFNTPLPPGDYGNPTTDLIKDVGNEAQLEASGGAVGHWTAGYLKDLGLDFGWGPSSTLQWIFEHIHMHDGLTIGGSIVVTAILIRLITFPTVIMASDTSSKLRALQSIVKPLQTKQKEAAMSRDSVAMARARQELSKIYKDADIKLWKSFSPMIQIPIGFGFWRLTRNMADLPVPGMDTGGFFWFENLVSYDPYFILPVATGLIQHVSMRLGGEAATTTEASKKMRAIFVYILPVITPLFIGFAPAAVQVSFCTAAILSLCTTTALRQPFVRNFFKLAPIIRTTTTATPPYQGAITISSRVKDHPKNMNPTTPVKTGISGTFEKLKPNNIKAGMGELRKTVNSFVSDAVPMARTDVRSKAEKLAREKADSYEQKRAKKIQSEKLSYEAAQKAKRR